jgi:outer membrane protein assembly factor BamE (lipoprotein component of BamABCDE complex)
MLRDLLKNYKLKGKTIKELNELFGNIEYYYTLNNTVTFEVFQKWSGIDPVYIKYLILKLDKNKKVKSISFDEFKR